MKKIIFPLKVRMRGEKVANLQDALQLLLDRGLLLREKEGERLPAGAALAAQR